MKQSLQDVEVSERVYGGVELVENRRQPSRLGAERVLRLFQNNVKAWDVSGAARQPLDLGHQSFQWPHVSGL